MALINMLSGVLGDANRISPETWSNHVSSSAHVSSSMGYVYDMPDYDESIAYIVSSSYITEIYGMVFEAREPEYNASVPISPSDVLLAGDFVPRRNYYVSSSFNDDSNIDVTTFIAASSDYTGLTSSISTLDTIELGTTSNVEPDEPPFPDPPPVGPYDMNRFRKTYTHVRVRPKIRKYSSSP